jgi:hypothetical protein
MSTTRPGGTMSPARRIRGTLPCSVNRDRDRESVESPRPRRRHDSIDLALIVGLAAINPHPQLLDVEGSSADRHLVAEQTGTLSPVLPAGAPRAR